MSRTQDVAPLHVGSVSIAMCTYNAEKFLLEQLESFLRQTMMPAELVLQDDNSTDQTLMIVEAFSQRAPFPVFVARNQARLGPTGNFEKAMGRCRGDVVVFSDADDVWLPDRIEASARVLADRPRVGVVFSDANLVNQDLSPRGLTLWQSIGFTNSDQAAFEEGEITDALFRRTIGFGGTMAVRRTAIEAALPIPRPWGHDNWTAVIAAALYEVALLKRPLINYRQHGTQYSGGAGKSFWSRVREARKPRAQRDWIPEGSSFGDLATRLEALRALAGDPRRLERVLADAVAKTEHQRMREQLSSQLGSRVRPVLKDALKLRYRRYSNGILSALRDIAIGPY